MIIRRKRIPLIVGVSLAILAATLAWPGLQRAPWLLPSLLALAILTLSAVVLAQQRRLRMAQQRFERIVECAREGLWEVDLSVAPVRSWLSPRLHAMLGFEPGALGDGEQALRARVHPDDLPLCDAAVRKQHVDGTPLDVEVRVRARDGAYLWLRLRGSAVRDATGRLIGGLGSAQNVTEARAAREALVAATQSAQAANEAKSAFLATMSHEIRTPMNGIIGMTTLLADTVLGSVQREYVEAIRASSNSLLAIINDILDFSKIEAGKLDVERLEIDLRDSVEEVGSMLALQAATKGLELIVDVSADVPARVLGDPQRIRQCLVNLVSNAIKFTEHGEIVVAVRRLAMHGGDARLRFEVRDTGIGIACEALAGLFQPFSQADSSTTREFGGTGLGLSIVKRLVELMGGAVEVDSAPGRGSMFAFCLPLVPVDSSASAVGNKETCPCKTGAGHRILVVDDNATNRRVLMAQMEAAGFETHTAADAAEALACMRAASEAQRAFSVVLIDLRLPQMDGAMLGECIKADPPLASSRLVLLTSLDCKGDPGRFAALGFAAFLTKPVRARELRECVQRVLGHSGVPGETNEQALVTAGMLPSAGAERRHGGTVLVAEDNRVNQKVAQRFLERLGCTVRVVADGVEAVRVLAHERFDLVLMDMQMPVMDGLAATRRIREREDGGTRTPIVALTANAFDGQFRSCLDAGMDDVLTKPLDPARLRDVLERFVPRTPQDSAAVRPAAQLGLASAPVDLAQLGGLAAQDAEFMHELLAAFGASAASGLEEIRAALAHGERECLQRAAHRLKGASENIGATRLGLLATRLEASALAAPSEELAQAVDAAAAELGELETFFGRADVTFGRRRAS